MKVYKFYDRQSSIPYLDNCYIATEKINPLDEDATDAFSLKEFYRVGQIDYLQFRSLLKLHVLPLWANLDMPSKMELAKQNVAPSKAEKDAIYTESEQISHFHDIVRLEVMSRKLRWKEAMSNAAYRLLDNEIGRLMMYNDVKPFRDDYIEADLPHLVLWLTSGAYPVLGIDFTTTGFASKAYYSETIKNEALQILTK